MYRKFNNVKNNNYSVDERQSYDERNNIFADPSVNNNSIDYNAAEARDDYYDEYITDRILSTRELEKTYNGVVNNSANLMRMSDTILMDELDDLRRSEMATIVEYNTQRSAMILQIMDDMFAAINKRIDKIEKIIG